MEDACPSPTYLGVNLDRLPTYHTVWKINFTHSPYGVDAGSGWVPMQLFFEQLPWPLYVLQQSTAHLYSPLSSLLLFCFKSILIDKNRKICLCSSVGASVCLSLHSSMHQTMCTLPPSIHLSFHPVCVYMCLFGVCVYVLVWCVCHNCGNCLTEQEKTWYIQKIALLTTFH